MGEAGMTPRRVVIGLGLIVVTALGLLAWVLLKPLPPPEREHFPTTDTTLIVPGPGGHAYQFIAEPGITWTAARDAAARLTWHGHRGYLATITTAAEHAFVTAHVFGRTFTDVTYLGGRQVRQREWRWVTGPEGREDGGKGRLFWTGDENGKPENNQFANWQPPAFQHGGRWDARKVCCVTIYSYGFPQFSTSVGDGYWEEGVAGYLVEWGN
jgi:hypothetical protein